MSNTIGVIIVMSFMVSCIYGAYLLLTEEDEEE